MGAMAVEPRGGTDTNMCCTVFVRLQHLRLTIHGRPWLVYIHDSGTE